VHFNLGNIVCPIVTFLDIIDPRKSDLSLVFASLTIICDLNLLESLADPSNPRASNSVGPVGSHLRGDRLYNELVSPGLPILAVRSEIRHVFSVVECLG
jgi:hypothetical protein